MQFLVSVSVMVITQIAAFEYRENSPILLFPYSRAQVHCPLPAALANPADLPGLDNTYYVFSGSNPYTLEGLFSSTMRAGHSTGMWGVQVMWARTGIDVYAEDTAEISGGIMPLKYFAIGLGIQYFHYAVHLKEIDQERNHWNLKGSLSIMPVSWLRFSFMQENIMSYVLESSRKVQFPQWSLGAALYPVQGLEINYNINSTAFGYVNTISASANLMKYLSLTLGYSKETSSYAAALSFAYRHVSVSYGLRYHTHLGMTHALSLTLALKPLEMEAVAYSSGVRAFSRGSVKKININTCSAKELGAVPGLQPVYADRIMQYRRVIGPVSVKALTQIGMSRSDINALLDRVNGLKDDKETATRTGAHKNNGVAKGIDKDLFVQLVSAGIPAGLSLDIAEKIKGGTREDLYELIKLQKNLSPSQRQRIQSICRKYH